MHITGKQRQVATNAPGKGEALMLILVSDSHKQLNNHGNLNPEPTYDAPLLTPSAMATRVAEAHDGPWHGSRSYAVIGTLKAALVLACPCSTVLEWYLAMLSLRR